MLKCEYNKSGDTMSRRFKPKKKYLKIGKYTLIIVIILLFCYLFSLLSFSISIPLSFDDRVLLDYMLKDFNVSDNKNFFGSKPTLSNYPISILKQSSYYMNSPSKSGLVFNEEAEGNFIKIDNDSQEPLVYIYNTHPTEEFIDDELINHNLTPTIRSMADVLKEKLEDIGVPTLVEQGSVSEYLKANGLNYNQSYQGSRYYLKQVLEKHDSIRLFIDLHRDGTSYKNSVTEIDGKKYARVMFVVGGGQKNYESTLKISNELHEKIKDKYPSLTRGIYEHKDSVFNQDLNPNMILLELGGNYNQLSEVLNTIELLAPIIKEHIYETRN